MWEYDITSQVGPPCGSTGAGSVPLAWGDRGVHHVLFEPGNTSGSQSGGGEQGRARSYKVCALLFLETNIAARHSQSVIIIYLVIRLMTNPFCSWPCRADKNSRCRCEANSPREATGEVDMCSSPPMTNEKEYPGTAEIRSKPLANQARKVVGIVPNLSYVPDDLSVITRV